MCAQVLATASHRPLASYTPSPSIWGDKFLKYRSDPQVKEKYAQQIEALKTEVRSVLTAPATEIEDTMLLIDTIERLGVSYHFKNEIEEKIGQCFNLRTDHFKDLSTAADHFRLFRQHGYAISCDIFSKWIDGNGQFQEELKRDAKGLLSLYEASFLRTPGETILDEALVFTRANLISMAPDLRSPLKEQVAHALVQSLHFGGSRIEARHFISIYEEEHHRNEILLKLAKLDFNLLQMLHKEELKELTMWWKQLDLISKLPYARDRLVECYFWAMLLHHEPEYSRARVMLAKSITFTSILDDTYDSYGTIEELDLLTEAIQRWDSKETDRVPEFIKEFYDALLKLHQQFEEELAQEGRSYASSYTIEAFKELAKSYHVEAQWFIQGYMPPFEEYLSNALITAGNKYLNITSLMGMKSIMKEDFKWLNENPQLIVAVQKITRLMDDVASYEIEKSRGQIATGVDCFMKDYGVSKEEAMNKFSEMTIMAWKVFNQERLGLFSVPRDISTVLLNFNRIIDVTYKNNEDGYTKPEKVLKPHIIASLVDAIHIRD